MRFCFLLGRYKRLYIWVKMRRVKLDFPARRLFCERMEFFKGEWRNLIYLNYEVSPDLLKPYLPKNLELDLFEGKAYVSAVPLILHKNKTFAPHLRFQFYVKRKVGNEWRRGTMFFKTKKIGVKHNIFFEPHGKLSKGTFEYEVPNQFLVRVRTEGTAQPGLSGYLEQFVADRFWHYDRRIVTWEFKVDYQPWSLWEIDEIKIETSDKNIFPKIFRGLDLSKPVQVNVAKGSPIILKYPRLRL